MAWEGGAPSFKLLVGAAGKADRRASPPTSTPLHPLHSNLPPIAHPFLSHTLATLLASTPSPSRAPPLALTCLMAGEPCLAPHVNFCSRPVLYISLSCARAMLWDVAGTSRALAAAAKAGIPKAVVARARDILGAGTQVSPSTYSSLEFTVQGAQPRGGARTGDFSGHERPGGAGGGLQA